MEIAAKVISSLSSRPAAGRAGIYGLSAIASISGEANGPDQVRGDDIVSVHGALGEIHVKSCPELSRQAAFI